MTEAALDETGEVSAVAEYKRTAALSAKYRIRPTRSPFLFSISIRFSTSVISRRARRLPSSRLIARAHPRRMGRLAENPRERSITLHLPDLGSSKRNGQVDALMQEFARRLIAILKAEK